MDARIVQLNDPHPTSKKCVVYVMSRDQRVRDNHALLAAQAAALKRHIPLVVLFVVYPESGYRAFEHYKFMLEGLQQVSSQLDKLNIDFIILYGKPIKTILNALPKLQPYAIYFDFNPLRGPRTVCNTIASSASSPVYLVDTHNIIPAWVASDKEEYAAHTFRKKIHPLINEWLKEPGHLQKMPKKTTIKNLGVSFEEVFERIKNMRKNGANLTQVPGESAAQDTLEEFIASRLPEYAQHRNNPNINALSQLSPYLHFGHISSTRVALRLLEETGYPPHIFKEDSLPKTSEKPTTTQNIDIFLEELIVRKELADNFCYYNEKYDTPHGARSWALESINKHSNDPREFIYRQQDWESAATHDMAWNAAQLQMMKTGKMHGYMRMYWAKKILEWSNSPEEALQIAVYLNDTYSIDGGDPNGYVGIMWSILGVHDRAWPERSVYGKVRYMNSNGLARRFDLPTYISKWAD